MATRVFLSTSPRLLGDSVTHASASVHLQSGSDGLNGAGSLVLSLTIQVVEKEDGQFMFTSSTVPHSDQLPVQRIEEVFRSARVMPKVGTYTFQTVNRATRFVAGPEGTTVQEGRNLSFCMAPISGARGEQLVDALHIFPSDNVILQVVQQVIKSIILRSLEEHDKQAVPVPDVRLVAVAGVICTNWGFEPEPKINQVLTRILEPQKEVPEVMQIGSLKFSIVYDGDLPSIKVGYLTHSNPFAKAYNVLLADLVVKALHASAVQVAHACLDEALRDRQRYTTARSAILATYPLNPPDGQTQGSTSTNDPPDFYSEPSADV